MKNKFILILTLLVPLLHAKAQVNLVPNPSFEQIDSCFFPGGGQSGLCFAAPWFAPTFSNNPPHFGSSTELYSPCFTNTYSGVPTNMLGYQEAKEGNNYAGFYGYLDFFWGGGVGREYLEVKLMQKLTPKQIYCVKFYVSLANLSWYDANYAAISSIGACFSSDTLFESNVTWQYIPVVPQIENADSIILSDTLNWMEINGYFTAQGGEEYMTIGNFRSGSNTPVILGGSTGPWGAYYYIDDISVTRCSGTGADEINMDEALGIYPNPAHDELKIDFGRMNIERVSLFSLLAEKLSEQQNIRSGSFTLDISALPPGIYFLQIETAAGIINRKFVKE